MKRLALLFTAGAMALAAGFMAAPSQAADKEISVVTWNIPYYQKGFQQWVDAFKKIHPDYDVKRIDMKGTELPAWYQTQVVAGTPPDVLDLQGGIWLQYASQGGLLDLTPYLAKDQDYAKRMYPEVLNNWVYKGKNYGAPLYISKTLLFLNREMMKKAGITRDPTNFAEMMEDAKKMASNTTSGFITLNFDWLYWPLFKMNGIDFVTPDLKKAAFNTPESLKLVEELAKLTKEGVIDKVSWTGRWVEPNSAFAAGNVGMLHAHAPAYLWFKSKANWVNEDTVGAINLPGGWSTPNSHALVISAGSKHPDAAWDFVKIATSGDGAIAFGEQTNNLMGDKIADAELMKYFEKNIPAVVPALKTQLENLDKLTGNWPFAQDAAIKEAFYPELQAALLGQKSAKEALDAAEKKVNRILEAE